MGRQELNLMDLEAQPNGAKSSTWGCQELNLGMPRAQLRGARSTTCGH